ncbi:MAG: hypothetical protein QGH73_10605 [Rhodospirillales bacterium]|jgi:hypothetical protein|nr:hypothetical protein [Rhodospirillales bacterium]MDP6643762.1 hypothetical protein [Rhodospirillales bacterium]MDP6842119.1 hypothetical protein [Rhodospirillales bacterium]
MEAAEVKELVRGLGADLVGIAGVAALEAYPPDPRFPQVPSRISPYGKSVIVLAKHIPAAAFRASVGATVRYMDNLVIRRVDRLAHRLARELEARGIPSLATITNETDWELKKGTYGYLSNRHLAVEAGLGTVGLNVNLVTPEYGSRVYVAAVLSEHEFAADAPMTEQVCIGEGCSRCLYGCPADAVGHFALDKRSCSTQAQVFGFAGFTAHVAGAVGADAETRRRHLYAPESIGYWQAMTRVAGCFGACPRCHGVCPIGDDYETFLAGLQKEIPEKTPEKVARGKEFKAARRVGESGAGLDDWNIRWVGPDGYTGRALRERVKTRRETEPEEH